MRRFPASSNLTPKTLRKLAQQTERLTFSADPKVEAERLFRNARGTKWFAPVVLALKLQTGRGERCMYCSGSESAAVEHYKPKAPYPSYTFEYENLLWVCPICNTYKGNRFPLQAEGGAFLINPRIEDVWSFFLIDEFAMLTARYRDDLEDIDPRAQMTIDGIKLNREPLQEARLARLRGLSQSVTDTLARYRNGELSVAELRERFRRWIEEPLHPDIANYFFCGPDEKVAPFADFLAIVAVECP